MSDSRMFVIVVAGGKSTRYGSNKLFELINGKSVLDHSVDIAIQSGDGVIVVTDPAQYFREDVFAIVAGGDTRSQSVLAGLNAVPDDVEIIAVADAARPGVTVELYKTGRSLIEQGNVAVAPAIMVADTIKTVDGNVVTSSPDRNSLRAIQTPQIFSAEVLRKAYASGLEDTDDTALVQTLGEKVVFYEGLEQNRKITTRQDLLYLRALLEEGNRSMNIRIGYGYDIHPFSSDENRKLTLAGVAIDHRGLDGHSDSDAIAHALTDALLSAIGAPDLGTIFSANDSSNKDISSFVFLSHAVSLVEEQNYTIGNVAIVINAEKPKLSSYIESMKDSLIIALKSISDDDTIISITPKHGEGVGEIGAGQAISVTANVLLK